MAREAVFLSYRRDDTADVAGRIYDSLAKAFGSQRIFKDVNDLRPGADFGDTIVGLLPKCRAVLVLIGPAWLDTKSANGQRRLDDPNDWVRIEIETALNSDKDLYVVPVLVNGAQMPSANDLPVCLQPLLRRHAAAIRRDPDFHNDAARLADALRASVKSGVLDLAGLGADLKRAASELAASPHAAKAVSAARSGLFTFGKLALVGGIIALLIVVVVAVVVATALSSYWPQEWTDAIEALLRRS